MDYRWICMWSMKREYGSQTALRAKHETGEGKRLRQLLILDAEIREWQRACEEAVLEGFKI